MNFDLNKVFPDDPSIFSGSSFVRVKAVTSTKTPPGAALNGVAFIVAMSLFAASIGV